MVRFGQAIVEQGKSMYEVRECLVLLSFLDFCETRCTQKQRPTPPAPPATHCADNFVRFGAAKEIGGALLAVKNTTAL